MGRLFDTRLYRERASESERDQRVAHLLRDDTRDAALLTALADELAAGDPPDLVTLVGVVRTLSQDAELDDETRTRFWADLSARRPSHSGIMACYSDALFAASREDEAAAVLVAAIESEPGLIGDFHDDAAEIARACGGELWLRYQLVDLGVQLDDVEQAGDSDDAAGEASDVRERYSELLEEHMDDAAALARIQVLGRRIAALEAAGILPRVLVRRGSWRGRPQ
ncbi:MAG: hypothetical protein MJE77_43680 [Proteobacteria bacterium]|nr:hypothetical protein [Pseudomonadota bacterium]